MPEVVGKITAPEFPEGLEWLNTARPLSLRELRGKVVLLDFWTYCCINCMHVIPELKKLEKRFEKELVVIGVHSGKFTTEKATDNIRQAILRYGIEHPVVNDSNFLVWRLYGARAWPTLVLIDPQGKIVGQVSGEITAESFGEVIAQVIRTSEARGKMSREPLRLSLEREKVPASVLSFPGKVLADESSRRLFIADSNHHRIVIVSLDDSSVRDVIGRGEAGLLDGSFEEAMLNHPQGMALEGETLYIADTENHALRQADLKTRTITTIAGTGQQARTFVREGVGTSVALNSPWDLVVREGRLYIAMAGAHQLWAMDLRTRRLWVHAGSGYEGRRDGDLLEAALAQPSGITTDGKRLYVADSEASAIRVVDIDPTGRVETIVGQDLFEFGDRDGTGHRVRLQHPLGVVYYDGVLYVADTYNNKIKKVFPTTRAAMTYLGTGEGGWRDGDQPLFDEPGGVSIAGGKLYIADTNNHVIRVADLKTGIVTTLELKAMEKLRPPRTRSDVVRLAEQRIAPGKATLRLSLQLPKDHTLTEAAPSQVVFTVDPAEAVLLGEGQHHLTVTEPRFPLTVPLIGRSGRTHLAAELTLYYCRSGQKALCYFKHVRLEVPITVVDSPPESASQITLSYTIK